MKMDTNWGDPSREKVFLDTRVALVLPRHPRVICIWGHCGPPCLAISSPELPTASSSFVSKIQIKSVFFSFLVFFFLRRQRGDSRVADCYQKRTIPDAESRLLKDLHWAGLSWDEGPDVSGPYGPYRQSERLGLYWTHIDKLLATGKAYRCFCSIKELEEYARAAEKSGGYGYPGTCRDISPEESEERAANGNRFVVRFRSHETPLFVEDIVFHRFRKKLPEEDFIIMKSDGWPTYHFANVVDDKHMHITHVIRGSVSVSHLAHGLKLTPSQEWLPSTPKHLALYKAFDWEAPKFAHVGLLVDANNQKLSKRHLGVDLNYYKSEKRHTLPAALLNFVSLLGWGTKTHNSDIMTLQDMVDRVSLHDLPIPTARPTSLTWAFSSPSNSPRATSRSTWTNSNTSSAGISAA